MYLKLPHAQQRCFVTVVITSAQILLFFYYGQNIASIQQSNQVSILVACIWQLTRTNFIIDYVLGCKNAYVQLRARMYLRPRGAATYSNAHAAHYIIRRKALHTKLHICTFSNVSYHPSSCRTMHSAQYTDDLWYDVLNIRAPFYKNGQTLFLQP